MQAVGLVVELWVAWRLRAEGIDVRAAVAEEADALGEGGGRRGGGDLGRGAQLGGGALGRGRFGGGFLAFQDLEGVTRVGPIKLVEAVERHA